jgi:hypothetical protein
VVRARLVKIGNSRGIRLAKPLLEVAAPAVRKVVARAFDHAGAQGDDQCGVTARLSKLTSGSG